MPLFQQTLYPRAGAPLPQPPRLGGRERNLLPAARVGVNDWHVAQRRAEGASRWRVVGRLPAAEPAQGRPGLQSFDQRPGGEELLDPLGQVGVRQPHPRTGRTALPAPLVGLGKAAPVRRGDDFAALLVQRLERSKFGFQDGKPLPLQLTEDRRPLELVFPTLRTTSHSNAPRPINLNKSDF